MLVYLATPAIWPDGWRIPVPDGARLRAAATGEPQPMATTTPGQRWKDDRVLRWAVPAGSVYLLQFDDDHRAADWAGEVHGTTYGRAKDDRPVPLRIPDPPAQRGAAQMDHWVVYLLGQGLGDLRSRTTIRPYVAPGEPFALKMRLRDTDESVAALTLASLWLLSAYGGIGARTRRGFGGVRIVGAEGWLPSPWTTESIQSPGLGHYEALKFLWPDNTVGKCLVPLLKNKEQRTWTAPPSFPVLHRQYTVAGSSGGGVFDNWDRTLRHAGEQLRNFRASRDAPGARYDPARKTPEWEDVVWGPENHFPIGALGLPVVFKGAIANAERGADPLRRASPLWLRAIGSDDEWRLFSFAFLGEFLPGPDAPVVNLRKGSRQLEPLRVDTADIAHLARQWIDEMAADGSFVTTRRHHAEPAAGSL